MLSLGLTGGIAAGKSLLSQRFRELGALVVDADQLARDVVAPGTTGLAAVVDAFGKDILLADGALNRAVLGALVFSDSRARETLNGIVHPLVRSAAAEIQAAAGPGTVVVQDIPLLVETGQGANFHLVVVVESTLEERVRRMVTDRGMSRKDALARIAAQASDAERAVVADILIRNIAGPTEAIAAVDRLWHERIRPFAANIAAEMPADASLSARRLTPAQLTRLTARVTRVVGERMVDAQTDGAGAVAVVVRRAEGESESDLLANMTNRLAQAAFFSVPPSRMERRGTQGGVDHARQSEVLQDSRYTNPSLWQFKSADPALVSVTVRLRPTDPQKTAKNPYI